ncbi:MAG: PRC and DUF2382 domain-containing protein [Geodermatophilaceae bacterium]|nr:PRC and DUF2382 domain-containing protein [Geodermatophilaceae bacterium]
MLSSNDVSALMGSTVQDSSGAKIGKVGQVYLDDESGSPEWVTVSTGMFGGKESFVPVGQGSFSDGVLTVPVTKDAVKDAPQVDEDGHLSPEQEGDLYRHYGLQQGGGGEQRTTSTDQDTDRRDRAGEAGVVGRDTSGPTTDDAMTRSEERLNVGTESVQSGRARLRKYITTETQNVQVPVSREEIRIEREPITDANRGDAMSGADLTEEEHEVTLTEERAVVNKETVPVERGQMGTETVTDTQQVSEEVRSEQIEVDGDTNRTTDRPADTDRDQPLR